MSSQGPTPDPSQGQLSLQTFPSELEPPERQAPAGHVLWHVLAIALGLLVVIQLLAWVPHYLTWPWWSDHDVFASAARAWQEGVVPYEDYRLNNFPGTVYLFWVLGTMFGWGETLPLYAFDVALLVLLGVLLWFWSRRLFGAVLPGLTGYALFVSYYLDLNYALTAQRDWHAPFFLLASLLVIQTWPGRGGWIVAGLSAAIGGSIRPQTIVFVPALVVAIDQQVRQPGEPRRKTMAPLATFAAAAAAGLTALFLPLFAAAAFDDFLTAIGTLDPGDTYSRTSVTGMFRLTLLQLSSVKLIALPAVAALLLAGSSPAVRRPARAWALAFAGALTYAPISPVPHLYLRHPLMLFWSMMGAILVAIAIEARRWPTATAAALVLLVLSSGVLLKPRFSDPGRSVRAVVMEEDRFRLRAPLGYTSMAVLPNFAARYPWPDYQAVLNHLRSLPSSTRVANALYGVPALAGPSGHVPLFPAESIALLTLARQDAEDAFIEALLRHPDAVVVWSPAEIRSGRHFPLPRLFAAIKTHYRHERSFGEIEVWRRRETQRAFPPTARRVS